MSKEHGQLTEDEIAEVFTVDGTGEETMRRMPVCSGKKRKAIPIGICRFQRAVVRYMPTNHKYQSEIDGSDTVKLLNKSQRLYLAEKAKAEYMEQ